MNPGRSASLSTLSLAAPHEVEEHLAHSNRFFQQSRFTLDDLDVYAIPCSMIVLTLQRLAHGSITEADAVKVMREAASEFKQIDDSIEVYAAAQK